MRNFRKGLDFSSKMCYYHTKAVKRYRSILTIKNGSEMDKNHTTLNLQSI